MTYRSTFSDVRPLFSCSIPDEQFDVIPVARNPLPTPPVIERMPKAQFKKEISKYRRIADFKLTEVLWDARPTSASIGRPLQQKTPPVDWRNYLVIRWINQEVGYGVFATQLIRQGTEVCTYAGVIMPYDQAKKFDTHYLYRLNDTDVISAYHAGGIGGFLQDMLTKLPGASQSLSLAFANLKVCKTAYEDITYISFVAANDIQPGEQLGYSYSEHDEYWEAQKGRAEQQYFSKDGIPRKLQELSPADREIITQTKQFFATPYHQQLAYTAKIFYESAINFCRQGRIDHALSGFQRAAELYQQAIDNGGNRTELQRAIDACMLRIQEGADGLREHR